MNPIPDGHSSWSIFEKILEGNQIVMKNVLENSSFANSDADQNENKNDFDAKLKVH